MSDRVGPALRSGYDALLVDLDGVVRLADQAIAGAAASLADARAAGGRVVFVTNNAALTGADVAAGLGEIGVVADEDEVLTSSMAAARLLASRLPPAARVLVVGGAGLRGPVEAAGLVCVARAEDDPSAVVQGWSPDLTWALLAEASVAVRTGVPWIATNRDATLPSPRGPLPGNGAMIATVVTATGREPEVVGKPGPAMFEAAVARLQAKRPLVVGDRLDTDIVGANTAGMDSLLVLTGVSTAADLVAAPPEQRPTYVGADLRALALPAVPIIGGGPAADGLGDDGLADLREACRRAWSQAEQ